MLLLRFLLCDVGVVVEDWLACCRLWRLMGAVWCACFIALCNAGAIWVGDFSVLYWLIWNILYRCRPKLENMRKSVKIMYASGMLVW